MSGIIDFGGMDGRRQRKERQAEEFPYDRLFPDSVSFVGEPWTVLSKHIGPLEHGGFCEFPKRISEDCKLGNGGSKYDVVKTPEELKVFVGSKGIR